jgi:epoxyqueuosine reductase
MPLSSHDIKVEAKRIGFDLVGITDARPFPKHLKVVQECLTSGKIPRSMRDKYAALSMIEDFADPLRSMPSARSIIVLGKRYLLKGQHQMGYPSDPRGRIGRECWHRSYAQLNDMRNEMLRYVRSHGGAALDANRVPTKAAANRSGIGTYGKNTIIQNEDLGSWVIYTSILTDMDLQVDAQEEPRCGACQRCIRTCPTKAITEPYMVDASRCIGHLLASPEAIPLELREAIGDRINGCDHCQEVCPRNDYVEGVETDLPDPFGEWGRGPKLLDILDIDEEEFKKFFLGLEWQVPDRRLLIRNALVALGNVGDEVVISHIQRFIGGEDEMLAEHATWAKENILKRCGSKNGDGAGTAI